MANVKVHIRPKEIMDSINPKPTLREQSRHQNWQASHKKLDVGNDDL